MTFDEFNALLERRIERTRGVLKRKADEYAANGDRLHNFKVAAKHNNLLPETVNLVWNDKHLVSIRDMVNDLEREGKMASREQWEEKIGDAINYLILLEGLVNERL